MLSTAVAPSVQEETSVLESNTLSSALVEVDDEHQLQQYVLGELVRESSRRDSAFEPIAIVVEDDANPDAQTPSFLDWGKFDEATLPPRANPRRSRLNKLLSPLNLVRAELPGDVTVEGLGGVIESAHNLFHSVQRLDYMESERTIHLPPDIGQPPPKSLPRRELERFENELFDVSKYSGSCDYLTVLAWAEEGLSGSTTLYKVLFDDPSGGAAVGIRPVAAMRDVPTPVLVNMRTHERVKRKAVFVPIDEDADGFRWTANPSRGPTYVRLDRAARSLSPPRSAGRSRSRSRSRNRSSSGRYGPSSLADADGICATIPQFLALLHARRWILEDVKSSSIGPLATEDGDVKLAVTLIDPPRSNPHEGGSVHVAVLMPDDAPWADEEIVWTDQSGLAEFRQRRYWDLIGWPTPRRSRGRSGSRVRGRSHSQHPSDSRRHSRSQSRHV